MKTKQLKKYKTTPRPRFRWWWEDEDELKVWKHLNALSPQQRKENKYADLCREVVQRYGNIYFYRPIPKLLPFHQDENPSVFIHGNNGSGKTYAAVAERVCYPTVGWSPYREIKPPPFGGRTIWIVTTSFKIQKASSQLILFSDLDAPERDIGLFPALEYLESVGVNISWEDKGKGILNNIQFPGVRIEFKSMEQRAFNLAGAAVDDVLLDEAAPAEVYDECQARILRKNGHLTMSFLLDDAASSYVVQDIYPEYEKELKKYDKSDKSFYFVEVEDNVYLDPQEVRARKANISVEGRTWRFSKGGKFDISPKGVLIYENYDEGTHLKGDLTEQFDQMKVLYRVWDLGYNAPCCTAFQLDKYNRAKIMFSRLGTKIQLVNFIEEVEALTRELMPDVLTTQEILPHDARRTYDTSPLTSENIFHNKGLKNTSMIYVNAEPAIVKVNELFSKLIKGQPAIQIDAEHANLVANCCSLYTRDEKTGKPPKGMYSHVSDNLKLMGSFIARLGEFTDLDNPGGKDRYPEYANNY